jgi:hypothetical protein
MRPGSRNGYLLAKDCPDGNLVSVNGTWTTKAGIVGKSGGKERIATESVGNRDRIGIEIKQSSNSSCCRP